MAATLATTASFAQQRYDDNRVDNRRMDDRSDRQRYQRDDRRNDSEYNDRNSSKRYDNQDMSQAYDEGFNDGMKSSREQKKQTHRSDYQNFAFGIYAGANSTRFQGENVDGSQLSGRLGYQLGLFVRGGGRLYGQIGAEYMTSSSEFYQPGDGKTLKDITGNVDQQYLNIPAYVGVKLAQSERGVSGIRLQVGAELATSLAKNTNLTGLVNNGFADPSLNGLANIGFDIGPLLIDFVYHYGFQNALKENTLNSQRRVLGVNVGFKF